MILPKVPIVISTLFCLSGVISAACPKSSYTASQGTVLSPGFSTSESYGDDLSCTYNIIVPVGHRITLEFITLSILGTMPNCTEDSLEIFVGCSNTSIGKFCSCSDLSMPKIYSRDNCMTLVFKSDGSKRGRGFEAFYTSTDNTVTKLDSSSNCSTKFQNYSSHGAIFTPNWPLKYPKSSSCSWTFHPPQSKVVRIFFSSFELEDENDNFHDCDPDRDPLKGDDIRINGTKTTGEQVTIKGRICFPPDVSFFPVKSMKAIEVRFNANANEFIGNGVIAGYATYKEGTLESSDPGCKSLSVTPGTSSTSSTSSTCPPTTLTGAEIAGITFGSLAGIAIIAFIMWCICCRTPK